MKLVVHTLTPLHIGGGNELKFSPYVDYIIEEDKVYYLDSNKILEIFNKYYGDYRNFLRINKRGNTFKKGLKEFLKEKKIDYTPFIKEKLSLKEKNKKDANLEIAGFINSPSGRYVPGSSIKGAIRTALWYAYIKNRERIRDRLLEAKGNKRFVFANFFGKEYNAKKGRLLSDPFRDIQIGDSTPISSKNFLVGDVAVFHLKKIELQSPIRTELLNGGVSFSVRFKLTDHAYPKDPFWHFVRKGDWNVMFSHINEFSKDFINHELREFEGLEGNEYIGAILEGYNNLLGKIDESDNQKAYMLIGQGTSFFSKTVDEVFTKDELFSIRKKFRGVSLGYKNGKMVSKEKFPITRKILLSTKKHLMGWVELSVEEG